MGVGGVRHSGGLALTGLSGTCGYDTGCSKTGVICTEVTLSAGSPITQAPAFGLFNMRAGTVTYHWQSDPWGNHLVDAGRKTPVPWFIVNARRIISGIAEVEIEFNCVIT